MGILLTAIPFWERALAIVALVAAVWGHGYVKGNQHGTAKLDNYIAKQAIESQKILRGQETITEKVIVQYREVAGKTEVVTNTVEKEVIRYEATNTTACLDPDWRRLHDAAALNRLPEPAGGVDGAGGTPLASEALTAVTENYARANRTADRLDYLQAWVTQQQQLKP
jgi:hypothetical protein